MAMAQIPKIPGNLAVAGLANVAMQPVELRNFVIIVFATTKTREMTDNGKQTMNGLAERKTTEMKTENFRCK